MFNDELEKLQKEHMDAHDKLYVTFLTYWIDNIQFLTERGRFKEAREFYNKVNAYATTLVKLINLNKDNVLSLLDSHLINDIKSQLDWVDKKLTTIEVEAITSNTTIESYEKEAIRLRDIFISAHIESKQYNLSREHLIKLFSEQNKEECVKLITVNINLLTKELNFIEYCLSNNISFGLQADTLITRDRANVIISSLAAFQIALSILNKPNNTSENILS